MIDRSMRVAMPKVNREDFADYVFAIPKVDEQRRIANYVKQANQETDSTIQKIHQEITLLQEYRTALIAEAVTGKIDVR